MIAKIRSKLIKIITCSTNIHKNPNNNNRPDQKSIELQLTESKTRLDALKKKDQALQRSLTDTKLNSDSRKSANLMRRSMSTKDFIRNEEKRFEILTGLKNRI